VPDRIGIPGRKGTLLVLFDAGKETALKRDRARDRAVGEKVIERQYPKFSKARDDMRSEPGDPVDAITPENAHNSAAVRPVGSFDRRNLHGPFDIIGDVQGCLDELSELVGKLGYVRGSTGRLGHPDGRTLVFLGDLADRGPKSAEVFDMVISLVEEGVALYTPGNHCNKLLRYLKGNKVSVGNGLEGTIESLAAREQAEEGFTARVRPHACALPRVAQ
jgi:protein phosphatase